MIRKAKMEDIQILADLALQLWPQHTADDLVEEFSDIIQDENAAFFLAFDDNVPIGFAQCQLRYDYVEGTHSSPVGYLEGIYVLKTFRKHGFARDLLSACEDWAKSKGCQEFASDCELDNTRSLAFHLNVGFTEANRIICFTKKLQEGK